MYEKEDDELLESNIIILSSLLVDLLWNFIFKLIFIPPIFCL